MLKPQTPRTIINNSANGAVTATQTSGKVNAGGYSNAKAFLNISAVSGTTPTLVVQFQDSSDGVNWTNVTSGAFSSQNATGVNSLVLSNVGLYLRAVQTLGGTTPSFTYDLHVVGL